MAATDDSTPNFDFLGKPESDSESGWVPPADSALDLLDRPTEPDTHPNAGGEGSSVFGSEEATDEPAQTQIRSGVETSEKNEPDDDETTEQTVDPAPTEEAPAVDAFEPEETAVSPAREPKSKKVAALSEMPDQPAKSRKRSGSSQRNSAGNGFAIQGPLAICLISYAMMLTILVVYLLMFQQEHQLESLPDRAPLSPDEFRYVPETASLAPGHTLRIGETAKFGHIRVEPLRVTRSTAELEHYAGRAGLTPPPAGEEIVQLWLKLTNESNDQQIAPFDRRLIYDRRVDDDFETHADQYVVSAGEQGSPEPNAHMYDLSPDGEWDLAGQELPVLAPGESVTTYLAAGPEELDQLDGPAVWRMLMRKGYHEATGHGVLTLIDVHFDGSTIASDG